jgi:hypothetical protein
MLNTKKTIITWLLITTMMWVSFWYLEEGMYCNINDLWAKGKSITVSLNKNDGGKCAEYVKYLELKMKNTYKDILTIQGYINKHQDAWYRRPIKDIKIRLLNDLQKWRINILINMRKFETNLLTKSKSLFLEKIQKQKKKLENALVKMASLSWSNRSWIDRYIQLATDTLNAIKWIENAKTFTRYNEKVKSYLYLTKQLGWK